MPSMSDKERLHYREGELGPGVSERRVSSLPKIEGPQVWELSAHPHEAERAGKHIDLRLGDPATGIAHSFVLPKRAELPKPGEMALVVPTYDHTLDYMDYTGPITTDYGRGTVQRGRRTKAEVYHAEPNDPKKTMLRFNLYDGAQPEEFAVVRTKKGALLVNKTQTREGRLDIPSGKESYKEIQIDDVDPTNDRQAMMPKLDGAHAIIDLKAGRSPRVFSYRVAKKAETGLIEHTHKMPELLKDKVPKELDGTLLRGEVLGVTKRGPLPAEQIGGLLNSKVWESRAKQGELGARLQVFPFDVIQYKGKSMSDAPFGEKLKVLKEVESKIADLWIPEIASTPEEKIDLLNRVKSKQHPLTEEGVVLVEPGQAARPVKAKIAPDFDVYVRGIHAAKSGETGEPHDRAGSVSYSWTPDGPIVGQLGGFKHGEGRAMLQNPKKYIGRVAKVKAMKVFKDDKGDPAALFQPRFKEWHLDKGDIHKLAFLDELRKISEAKPEGGSGALVGVGAGWGAASGAGLAQKHLSSRLAGSIKPSEAPMSGRTVAELQKRLSLTKAFNTPHWQQSMSMDKGGIKPMKRFIGDVMGLPKKFVETGISRGAVMAPLKHSPEFLAHELGHASFRDPARSGRLVRTLIKARGLGPLAGIIGGGAMLAQDPDSAAAKLAPAAVAAGYAPMLADEAGASLKGVRTLKSMGKYTPAMGKSLGRAFGTYALPAAAATGVMGLASYLRSRMGKAT